MLKALSIDPGLIGKGLVSFRVSFYRAVSQPVFALISQCFVACIWESAKPAFERLFNANDGIGGVLGSRPLANCGLGSRGSVKDRIGMAMIANAPRSFAEFVQKGVPTK